MTIDRNTTVLGVLEYSSMAIGVAVLDEMVKIAPIKIIDAHTICPGKYIIVFCGDVASAEYSYNKGLEVGQGFLVDSFLLPQIHPEVLDAIGRVKQVEGWDSIGIIETLSVASAIEAADIAAKVGGVTIVEIRLAIGFGGKSYLKMMGSLFEVQAAMDAALARVEAKKQLCAKTVISQPHEEIRPFFLK
ncbi:MAG: BMC domain-containing protein [Tenuifilaceae bacterium]|jgi:microcompartment protein CcmL/EutN|nr:BMC domain-containing protein [Tenuifilaceae bacterium]